MLLRKLASTKFILASSVVIIDVVLLCCHLISADNFVSVMEIIIPAYFATNVVASHRSFISQPTIIQPPEPIDPEIEQLRDNLKHGL